MKDDKWFILIFFKWRQGDKSLLFVPEYQVTLLYASQSWIFRTVCDQWYQKS